MMEFSLGEPFEIIVIHRHDLPDAVVGLAAHLKPQSLFGFRVSQGHPGFIPLGISLGNGYGRGDPQDFRVVQVKQVMLQGPPYLGLKGFK